MGPARAFLTTIFAAAVFAGIALLTVPETWSVRSQWALDPSTLKGARNFLAQAEPEVPRCSAPEVIATVRSLSGENSDNPAAALLVKMAHATFSLDAIRTVSSSPSQSICGARLPIKTDLPWEKPGPHALYTLPESEGEKALKDQMYQQLATRVQKITYKVEKTDDGQFYVTVIPSEADVIEQQNRQQQLQQQQCDQEQRSRALEQESIDLQGQYRQDLQDNGVSADLRISQRQRSATKAGRLQVLSWPKAGGLISFANPVSADVRLL